MGRAPRPGPDPAVLTELRSAVAPLLRPLPPPVLIYGDLKPEHVLLGPNGTQTWIDPGLQRADTAAELAKLLSRVTLLLVTARPSRARITATVDTLDRLVSGFLARQSRAETLPVLRRLLALWFADWANYLASGLSLPPTGALPLPPTLLSATGQAQPLLRLCTDAAAHLTNDPTRAWCLALTGIRQLATGDTR